MAGVSPACRKWKVLSNTISPLHYDVADYWPNQIATMSTLDASFAKSERRCIGRGSVRHISLLKRWKTVKVVHGNFPAFRRTRSTFRRYDSARVIVALSTINGFLDRAADKALATTTRSVQSQAYSGSLLGARVPEIKVVDASYESC